MVIKNSTPSLASLGTASIFGPPVATPGETLYAPDSNGNSIPSPTDINQGQTGDCFLLSATGVLAMEAPSALENLIKGNNNGSYTVTLFEPSSPFSLVFSPVQVTVNPADFIAQGANPNIVNGNEIIWPLVIEDAYAQENGGYAAINEGGSPAVAMEQLTGQQAVTVPIQNVTLSLLESLEGNDLVTFDTLGGIALPDGIVGDHSYMYNGLQLFNGQIYVSLLNPWGVGSGQEPPPILATALAKDFGSIDYTAIPGGSSALPYITVPLSTNLAAGGSEVETVYTSGPIATESTDFQGLNGTGSETKQTINWQQGGSQITWYGSTVEVANYTGLDGGGSETSLLWDDTLTGKSTQELFSPRDGVSNEITYFPRLDAQGSPTEIIDNLTNGTSQVMTAFNVSPIVAAAGYEYSSSNGIGTILGSIFALQPGQDGVLSIPNATYNITSNTELTTSASSNAIAIDGSGNVVISTGTSPVISIEGTSNNVSSTTVATFSVDGSLNQISAAPGSTVTVVNNADTKGNNQITLSSGFLTLTFGAADVSGNGDKINLTGAANILNTPGIATVITDTGFDDTVNAQGTGDIITVSANTSLNNVLTSGNYTALSNGGYSSSLTLSGFADALTDSKSAWESTIVASGDETTLDEEGRMDKLTATGIGDNITLGSTALLTTVTVTGSLTEINENGLDNTTSVTGDANRVTLGNAASTDQLTVTGTSDEVVDSGAHDTTTFAVSKGTFTAAGLADGAIIEGDDNLVIAANAAITLAEGTKGNILLGNNDLISGGTNNQFAVAATATTITASKAQINVLGGTSGLVLTGDGNHVTVGDNTTLTLNGKGDIVKAAQGSTITVNGADTTIIFPAAANEVGQTTLNNLQTSDTIVINKQSLHCETPVIFKNGELIVGNETISVPGVAAFDVSRTSSGGERLVPLTASELFASLSKDIMTSDLISIGGVSALTGHHHLPYQSAATDLLLPFSGGPAAVGLSNSFLGMDTSTAHRTAHFG